MAPGPRAVATAPPARPPRLGIVNAAVQPDDGLRWDNGFSFDPEGCADGGVVDVCVPGTISPARCADEITADPFVVWAGVKRSTMGLGSPALRDELRARARRQLEATQSFHIAEELWTGALARAKSLPNQYLATTDSDVVTNGAATPLEALACLEQYLGQAQAGQQGMIHATRQVVTYWSELGVVSRVGQQLVTALDTIVVPDAGYDGSAPDHSPAADGSVWAYASGIVMLRLGDVQASPPTEDAAALYEITSNDFAAIAWRLAAYAWDGCALGAAEIDLDVCRIGGAS